MISAACEESSRARGRRGGLPSGIDIRIPTSDPAKNYQRETMEGGATFGYFAIRRKSDIVYETEYNGVVTQES